MGLTDIVNWAAGTDLLPAADTSANVSSVGHRTLTELSWAGELATSPTPAKFVTPGGGRGPRAGEVTPHSSEYADLQRAIAAADIATKNTPKSAKTKQMRLQKIDGSSVYSTPAPASPGSASDVLSERKAHMQQMLDADVITPAEYTKMLASLRAEAALTPPKPVQTPPVQTADESAASPIFTVDDTMTEPELAALAAERAETHNNEQAKKLPPNFTGSPATALAAAIDSGLTSAAAGGRQQDEHEVILVDTGVPPPCAVESEPAPAVAEENADTEVALPNTPVPRKWVKHRPVEKSPASAKADGILARWHKWDLDYARYFMHQQMELDELRQLALEFGP